MAYSFSKVTVRTDNSEEGMAKINSLWVDIMTGRIPLDFIQNGRPVCGLSPVSEYSNYQSDEKGFYDLTVMCADAAFFCGFGKKGR